MIPFYQLIGRKIFSTVRRRSVERKYMRMPLLLAVAHLLCFSQTIHSQDIIRGPYLQLGNPTSITIRWRTDVAIESRLRFGMSQEKMQIFEMDTVITREHEARLTNLEPNTKYYYSVGEKVGYSLLLRKKN